MRKGRPVVVFVPERGDHNPNHVRWLAEGWLDANTDAPMVFLVAPGFVEALPSLTNIQHTTDGAVRFQELTPARKQNVGVSTRREIAPRWPWLGKQAHVRLQRWADWQRGVRVATKIQARICLVLNFDYYQNSFMMAEAFPCPVSGIYHHLMFHYPRLFGSRLTPKERLRGRVQQYVAGRILARSGTGAVFCFDPLAAAELAAMQPKAEVYPLPMAAIIDSTTSEAVAILRARYGIEQGRRVFLLLGTIRRPRGFYKLVQSLHELPTTVAEQVCLLVVGRQTEPVFMQSLLERASTKTAAQIVSRDEFIPVDEISTHHALTDVVLATHTRHVGISESIAHAAAAGRPVLAPEFGLVGELVRRHHLGATVDCTSPSAIARGIGAFVNGRPDRLFDAKQAARFAANNNAQRFAQTLIDHLASP